jgi:hypothetical protein
MLTPCGSCKNRRNNPEDTILHSHRRENLKSYIARCMFCFRLYIRKLLFTKRERERERERDRALFISGNNQVLQAEKATLRTCRYAGKAGRAQPHPSQLSLSVAAPLVVLDVTRISIRHCVLHMSVCVLLLFFYRMHSVC